MNFQNSVALSKNMTHYVRLITVRTSSLPIGHRTFLHDSSTKPNSSQSTSSEEKSGAVEDRTTVDRRPDETSLSGGDDAVAFQVDVSYSSEHSNDPADVLDRSGRYNSLTNPLQASPANTSMSNSSTEAEGGAGKKTIVREEKGPTHGRQNKAGVPGAEKKKVFAGSTKGGNIKGVDNQRPLGLQGSR